MKTETETRWGRMCLVAAVCVAVGWCSFMSPPPVARSAPEAVVALDPAELVVEPGARFTIDVIIRDVSNLGSYEFTMDFDPAVVQVSGVETGGFLEGAGGSVMTVGPDMDNDGGTLAFGALAVGATEGAAGSGTLATVTLEAVGEGESPLALRNVQLVTAAGTELPAATEHGRVKVGTGTMPTLAPTETAEASPTPTSGPEERTPTAEPTATASPTAAAEATATWTPADAATATPGEEVTVTTVAPTGTEPDPTSTREPTETDEGTSTGETEVPTTEAAVSATPTEGDEPTVGGAETPAPTRTAEQDQPEGVARRWWLIPAAATLALLGLALIAGGLFLFGPRKGEEGRSEVNGG